MKITISGWCSHCGKWTEHIKFEGSKCGIQLCIECWREPTEKTKSEIKAEFIILKLQEVILTLKTNYKLD